MSKRQLLLADVVVLVLLFLPMALYALGIHS